MFISFLIVILSYAFIRLCWNWRTESWPEKGIILEPYQVHRGYWIEGIKENSISAFREAKIKGAKMIELDVHLSHDEQPVVHHDESFLEVQSNIKLKINDLTANELFSKANIPSLEQVLRDNLCPSKINIELKSTVVKNVGLEKEVCEIVINTQSQHRVLFSSFNPICLMRLSKILPEVPRALLVSNDKTDPKNKIYLRLMWLGFLAKPHMVNLNYKMLTPFLIRRLNERKIPIAVWTVNDETQALLLQNKGVVSIITDKFPLIKNLEPENVN